MHVLVLIVVAFIAGAQNALAGGGSFLTFPVLLFWGMDARAANITSTVALFPGQIATGYTGRANLQGIQGLPVLALAAISLAGGAIGAVLLLATPASFFAKLVPWLVLFATFVFAWSSFFGKPAEGAPRIGRLAAGFAQFGIAIYGGYFGGGIGILMLAALTIAGLSVRAAGATKNVLAGVMNASAVAIFCVSADVHWLAAGLVAAGAIAGGATGGWMLTWVNERALRVAVVVVGLALTVALFWRAAG